MLRYVLVAAAGLLLLSCSKSKPETNLFSDETLLRIADFQDRRFSDSLLQFFDHKVAAYRRAAALAFGSVQDTSVVEALGRLLHDPDSSVQKAAAFALGQTGGSKAFGLLLKANLGSAEFEEALGKTASKHEAVNIVENSWALYRLALRGLTEPIHITYAIGFLDPANSDDTRLGAAHFFNRCPVAIDKAENDLLRCAENDSSVFVRMAVVQALRKLKSKPVLQKLKQIIEHDGDYRVRVNAVRAMQSFPFDETITILFNALADENINVAIAASEVAVQVAKPQAYTPLVEKARQLTHWRVRANLFEAALSTTDHKELAEEIIQRVRLSENPYEQAALITALRHTPANYMFVGEQMLTASTPVVRSSAANSLIGMNKHKLFEKSMLRSFLELYQKALKGKDAAVIGTIATVLLDPALGYKNVISDYQFLYEAKQKLSLPKDNEALQPLERAIAYFEGRANPIEVKNDFNHPIDWTLVKTIPSRQQAVIKTSKGDIFIQLLVEEAPGSVANFVHLSSTGYFNGKNFHRVVPNFVIQGGCNRGDGWGSEDYSIRSEFSTRKYKEGSVGMASAGKDTEGTQWFITHSPTPHLDGRYTIFAEVVSGMDVVYRIEVGDEIVSVELIRP